MITTSFKAAHEATRNLNNGLIAPVEYKYDTLENKFLAPVQSSLEPKYQACQDFAAKHNAFVMVSVTPEAFNKVDIEALKGAIDKYVLRWPTGQKVATKEQHSYGVTYDWALDKNTPEEVLLNLCETFNLAPHAAYWAK